MTNNLQIFSNICFTTSRCKELSNLTKFIQEIIVLCCNETKISLDILKCQNNFK